MKSMFLFFVILFSAIISAQYVDVSTKEQQISKLNKMTAAEYERTQLSRLNQDSPSYSNMITIYNLKKERERLLGQISRLKNTDKQKTDNGLMVPGGNSHYDSLFAVVIKMIEASNKQLNGRIDGLENDIAQLKGVLEAKIASIDQKIEVLINKVAVATVNTFSEPLNRGKLIIETWGLLSDDREAVAFAKRLDQIFRPDSVFIDGFNSTWFSRYADGDLRPEVKKAYEKILIIIGEKGANWDYGRTFNSVFYLEPDNAPAIRRRFKEIDF